MEEERRLCYVGMTRAQDILILTRAEYRRRYGNQMPELSMPSRFLSEIPEHLLEDLSPASVSSSGASTGTERVYEYEPSELEERLCSNTRSETPSGFSDQEESRSLLFPGRGAGSPGLAPGSRVRHPKYGYGTVVQREGEGENTKLTVNFPGLGLKKLVESFARLERI